MAIYCAILVLWMCFLSSCCPSCCLFSGDRDGSKRHGDAPLMRIRVQSAAEQNPGRGVWFVALPQGYDARIVLESATRTPIERPAMITLALNARIKPHRGCARPWQQRILATYGQVGSSDLVLLPSSRFEFFEYVVKFDIERFERNEDVEDEVRSLGDLSLV
jgi:hypothetical protein